MRFEEPSTSTRELRRHAGHTPPCPSDSRRTHSPHVLHGLRRLFWGLRCPLRLLIAASIGSDASCGSGSQETCGDRLQSEESPPVLSSVAPSMGSTGLTERREHRLHDVRGLAQRDGHLTRRALERLEARVAQPDD